MKFEQPPTPGSASEVQNGQVETERAQVEAARQAAMEKMKGRSFKTEKGSVYTYGDNGQTQRMKVATGENFESQDITVFVDLSDAESRTFLDAIASENPDLKKKVYVVERQKDGQPRLIRKAADVYDPKNLYIGIFENGKMIGAKPATLKPTMGYSVFDTRHFQDDKEWKTERHLGHKVIEID